MGNSSIMAGFNLPPGYVEISGKRKPPASWGEKLWCILRGNADGPIVAKESWPVETTRWIHDGTAGDVIAVKKE